MPALYLDAQGAAMGREQGEYVVRLHELEQRFPVAQLERLVLLGNVQLTTQAIASLLHQKTPVFFLSSYGKFRGQLSAPTHANVQLRMQQYKCVRNQALALPVARWFVVAKIRNGKELVGRKLKESGVDASPLRRKLKRLMYAASHAKDMDCLRGFEGMAARTYFASFSKLFKPSPFAWKGRNRRPPKDPINAMLSLGYSLLLQECISAIEVIGMDMYAGIMHGGASQADYGQPSLALDMMEEFRYLVDRLVMRLLLSGDYDMDDFELRPDGACFALAGIRKEWFAAWEDLMQTAIQYDHRKLAYRMVIAEQVSLLARALQDESVLYRPFMP